MARGSQRDYHTLVERRVQRLLPHHHYNLLGGFLHQHVAIGLGMRGNDVLVRFMPIFFQLRGGCPRSDGLSPACLLLQLDPTLVRREIRGKFLWLGIHDAQLLLALNTSIATFTSSLARKTYHLRHVSPATNSKRKFWKLQIMPHLDGSIFKLFFGPRRYVFPTRS
jgi:hypothetical protein